MPIVIPIAGYLLYQREWWLAALVAASLAPIAGLWIAAGLIVVLSVKAYFWSSLLWSAYMILLGLILGKREGVVIGGILVALTIGLWIWRTMHGG